MKKLLFSTLIFLLTILLLTSCGGDNTEECDHKVVDGNGYCTECGKLTDVVYTIEIVTPTGTKTLTVKKGDSITEPQLNDIPEGYVFLGWFDENGNVFDFSNSKRWENEEDRTFTVTAKTEPKKWIINYVGYNCGNPTSYKTGDTVELKKGSVGTYHHVEGFYYDKDFTQPVTVISGMMEDITIWTKTYYLPYNSVTELDDGTVALSDPVNIVGGYWNEYGDNTFIIPQNYNGKKISSINLRLTNLTDLIIESDSCEIVNPPSSLKSITLKADHQKYKLIDGNLYSKDGTTLYAYCVRNCNTASIVIPEGVTTIAAGALPIYSNSQNRILSITLPSTLTTIENSFTSADILEIYNLSEHITLTKGGRDYGYIAAEALAIHTSLDESSIFDNQNGMLFANIEGENYLVYYIGNEEKVVLPDTYKGTGYKIYNFAFQKNNITEITVGSGVTYVNDYAFNSSSVKKISFNGLGLHFDGMPFSESLEEVHVKSIESWLSFTFSGGGSNPLLNNAKLYFDGSLVTDLVLSGDHTLNKYAFYGYKHINSLTVGEGVSSIPSYAFTKSSLSSIVFSEGILEIGSSAFENCSLITSVTLPYSLSNLGNDAFYGCADSVFTVEDNGLKYIGIWLVGVSGEIGERVVIKDGTVGISSNSIILKNVKELTIPESVKYIGIKAFDSLKNLEVINYNAVNATYGKEDSAFYCAGMNNSEGIILNVGPSVTVIPDGLFSGNIQSTIYGTTAPKIKEVVFKGNSVKAIGKGAFKNAIYLEAVTFSESLEVISDLAFFNCYNLKSIVIGKNITSIGEGAFASCTGLTSVTFNTNLIESVVKNGNFVFDNAGSNADSCVLMIGKDVERIVDYLFYRGGFSSVVFDDGSVCKEIGAYAFYGNSRITGVALPESTETLCDNAFAYCYGLTSITGEGLANVSDTAIYGCSAMPSEWGNDVYGNIYYYFKTPLYPVSNNITWAAFKPGSVIPEGFFANCLKLNHVYIPKGCTVGNEMFRVGSYSQLSQRLNLRVFFEEGDYNGDSSWRKIISYEGTDYRLGMVVSVNGENTVLGRTEFRVSLSKEGFAYTVDNESVPKAANILGYFANSEFLTVGGEIDGYRVYSVDKNAFLRHDGIQEIKLISVVIGDMAFAFSTVTKLTLEGVSDLSTGAFMSCISLTSAKLGDIEEIGAYAFNGCISLSEVTIESSSQHSFFIRDLAFAGCGVLTEITIPENTYTIGTGAFLESGIKRINTTVNAWYIIENATSDSPSIITTYTVTDGESLAASIKGSLSNYYWVNKSKMS